jgi:hypothetical protein
VVDGLAADRRVELLVLVRQAAHRERPATAGGPRQAARQSARPSARPPPPRRAERDARDHVRRRHPRLPARRQADRLRRERRERRVRAEDADAERRADPIRDRSRLGGAAIMPSARLPVTLMRKVCTGNVVGMRGISASPMA